ncbi:MAG: PilZ domain-containing protein [Desulfobacterales bacterium]|nr:PilZ domain-containing protein [Desulfobacterales bacterium]
MESMLCENAGRRERRSTPRMPYHTTAFFHSTSLNGEGTIRDLSSEGLFLETPFPLIVGDEVHILFPLRNSKRPVNVTGRVARNAPTGAGIQFLWEG